MKDVVKAHARRAHRKVKGQVDLAELEQIGMIIAWRAAGTYDGSGTLEGYLHSVLWRGFQDVIKGVNRRRTVISEIPLSEVIDASHHAAPDEEHRLRELVNEYRDRLSAHAYRVFREIVFPSKRTLFEVFATNQRRKHLRNNGVVAPSVYQMQANHVARGLNLPLPLVKRAVTEIRREVRKDFPKRNT